jgi:AmiR/NasT family two-component response regulator
MIPNPLPSVRGRHCIICSADARTVQALVRQLDLLGVAGEVNPLACDPRAEFAFLDIDAAAGGDVRLPCGFAKLPMIALVGTETPSRLEWMIQREPSAVLVKPLGGNGAYGAIVLALAASRRREQEFLKMLKLEERIRARRIVVAAIVKLMKEYSIEEPEAFGMLRNAAQKRRMTIEILCAEVVGNAFLPVRLASTRHT